MGQLSSGIGSGPANAAAVTHGSSVAREDRALLEVENLCKEYSTGQGKLDLLRGISFRLERGELLALVGQSGAGKSTLLHILGALDKPSSGSVYCATIPVHSLSPRQAAEFRNREIGYVWQFHYLLPEFTAGENVAMPLLARGTSKRQALEEAAAWLTEVGMADRIHHRTGELSGGEQQRVSIARALITQPKILLADEPTGDLDDDTAAGIFVLIERLHETRGLASILVTHNLALARRCDRVLRLVQGRIEQLTPRRMAGEP